jgi:hypothetical protein
MLLSRKTRTEERHGMRITGKELLECINQELAASGAPRIPKDASVVVSVPGGGDWSNTDLDLNDHPVTISWTVVEDSE